MAQLASCALAGDPRLRTPDAIRVAAAASLREELEPLVTYDGRMLLAAEAMAPPVASPARPFRPTRPPSRASPAAR